MTCRFSQWDKVGRSPLLPSCTGILAPNATAAGQFTVRCTQDETFYTLCRALVQASPTWHPAYPSQLIYFEAGLNANQSCAVDSVLPYNASAGYEGQCNTSSLRTRSVPSQVPVASLAYSGAVAGSSAYVAPPESLVATSALKDVTAATRARRPVKQGWQA
jgi:hypothetical protein